MCFSLCSFVFILSHHIYTQQRIKINHFTGCCPKEKLSLLPVFQMLDTAKAPEPPIDHNGHPCAQSFTFFHTMRKQNEVFLSERCSLKHRNITMTPGTLKKQIPIILGHLLPRYRNDVLLCHVPYNCENVEIIPMFVQRKVT